MNDLLGKRVLDPCCGSKMMWVDRQHPDVVFGDKRSETIVVTDRSNGRENGTRTLRIEPDTLIDFRALPYPDGAFKHVVFDPPHLHTAAQALRWRCIAEVVDEHWYVWALETRLVEHKLSYTSKVEATGVRELLNGRNEP